MRPLSLNTDIDATRDRVFDFICDLSLRPSWTGHFATDYRLARVEPSGVGAAARFWVDAPGGIRYMETVIAEAERPHLIAEHGRGGRLDGTRIRTIWELSETPGGVTEVQLTFWTEPGTPVGRIAEIPLAKRWWRRSWRRSLRSMRELIESGAEPQGRIGVGGGDRLPAGV
jgi:uncharacterized protein YndB with AHSA1/START domain